MEGNIEESESSGKIRSCTPEETKIVDYSYRGLLKSCNYRCGYCPFSKTAASPSAIRADREALLRFCRYIASREATPGSLQVFLLPYGEGMIHPHYTEALVWLSQLPSVRRISCQTNLSWDIDRFADNVRAGGGTLSRLAFWCSFHPSCTSLADFISQCKKLDRYGIRYCAGMVARPGCESLAEELRRALPPRIYMWLNGMDGLDRPYTTEETTRFNAIDPFFPLEQQVFPADEQDCRGGKESVFVRADGRTAWCPVAGGYSGNLYEPTRGAGGKCRAFRCRCYLAYSNRRTSGLEPFFGRGAFLRIPERTDIKNLFLDIDGTLTGADGELLPGVEKALSILNASIGLYFATELPYRYARKKCGSLFPLFAGGIFAGGAHIRLFRPERNHYFYIPTETNRRIDAVLGRHNVPGHAVKRYRTAEGIYRIAVTGQQSPELAHALSFVEGIRSQEENGLITLTSAETDKGKALAWLRRRNDEPEKIAGDNHVFTAPDDEKDHSGSTAVHPAGKAFERAIAAGPVAALGNGLSDIALFREADYPLSAPGSPLPVRRASLGTIPVTLLPVFFGR